MAVFPLSEPADDGPAYKTLKEALEGAFLMVSVVSQGSAVPVPLTTGNDFRWEGNKALARWYYSYGNRKASLLIVSVKIDDEIERCSKRDQ